MKAAAMSVWIFINLLCFGMCGYLYLIWSQYWMSIEKQRLFSKPHDPQQKSIAGISFQDPFSKNVHSLFNISALKLDNTIRKSRRSVVAFKTGHQQWHNKSSGTQGRPSNNIVVKSRGSPRFPNIHKPILEFDSEKYVCSDYTMQECKLKSNEFKELLLKEFHRVLMSESKVFTSGLASQNYYDVKYERGSTKYESREDVLCALRRVFVRTVTADDEPFASLGYHIPKTPLQEGRVFNTCAVVTSAGALLGSRLGEFIDSHEMVLRFNNAPTANFTDDVGSKTTFRVLNSQVVTKPEFNFLEDSLYRNVSILIWDPANYSSTLREWYLHPDFPVFSVYKRLLERRGAADVHLLKPRVLWDLWEVLQDSSAYRLRRNPPSSGFIGFTGIPDNIDAALVRSGNGEVYFYKGSKFWRFDPAQRPPVKSTYPKPLSNWSGIPDNIDAALQYTNGYTYFFKGGSYWRFNDRTFSVDTDNPAFPRSTGYWWLGCSSAPRGTVGGNERLTAAPAHYAHDDDDDDVGDIIFDADSHDMVLRFSNAPTANFTHDVGSKTTSQL